MIVNKRNSQTCELQKGEINQVQQFKHNGSILTKEANGETEIRRRIEKWKDAFPVLRKVL